MEEEEYQKIFKQVKDQEKEIQGRYEINQGNNILYKIKQEKKRRIIRRWELEPILYMIHDDPTGAHFSVRAMYEKLKERYYWPKMKEDIETYVKSCDQCQRRRKPKNKNKLNPIKVKESFYQIGIDIVGPLNETTEGNKYIVVAIDYFTKWPEARAIKEATAKEVSTFIYEEIICRHGCPKKIITDRGTHFNNRMIEELMNKFKV